MYLVTYQSNGTPDAVRLRVEGIATVLRSYARWAQLTPFSWLISTNQSVVQVRDQLLRHMLAEDRLMVLKCEGTAAWHNVLCSGEWLKANL